MAAPLRWRFYRSVSWMLPGFIKKKLAIRLAKDQAKDCSSLHAIVLFSYVIFAAGVLDIDRCITDTVCYYHEICFTGDDALSSFDKSSASFYRKNCTLIVQIKPFKANKWLIDMRVEGDELNVTQGLNLYQADTLIVGCSGNGLKQHSDIETEWWNPDQPIFNSTMIFCAFTASTNKTDFSSFGKIGDKANIRYTVKGTEKKIEGSGNALWTPSSSYLRCNPEDVIFNDTHNPDKYFVYPMLDSSGAKIDCSGSNGSILVVYNDTESMDETSEITCNADYEFEYATDTLGNKTFIPKGEILNAFCGVKVCTQCTRIPPPAQVGENYLPVEITPGNDTSCASLTCPGDKYVINKDQFMAGEAVKLTCAKSGLGVSWKVRDIVVDNISCFDQYECNLITPLIFECPKDEDSALCSTPSYNGTIKCTEDDQKIMFRHPKTNESLHIDHVSCNRNNGTWSDPRVKKDSLIYCKAKEQTVTPSPELYYVGRLAVAIFGIVGMVGLIITVIVMFVGLFREIRVNEKKEKKKNPSEAKLKEKGETKKDKH